MTIEDIINVAERKDSVAFAEGIEDAIKKRRTKLEYQLEKYPEIDVYGTNVGCGDLKDTTITSESFEGYQERYIKAHNCGTGEPLSEKIVRAIMVIRLNSFAKNLSAMRWETCERMLEMLNKEVTPEILEEGSVGASGDLVPLAMMAAALIGLPESWAYYKGERMPALEALGKAGIKTTKLGAKEAMGLTNGSNFIAAFGVFAVRDAELLIKNASISSALSLEAIRGEKDAFSNLINDNRPHDGQGKIADQIRNLINGSKRTTAEAQLEPFPKQYNESIKVRVQDRYSFRAIPPVHGAATEAVTKLREVIEIEINSATDNPLFQEEEIKKEYVQSKLRAIKDKQTGVSTLEKLETDAYLEEKLLCAYSGANFHGQPLATTIDYAKLSITGLSLITDKRTFSLLDKHLNFGLPGDLANDATKGDTGLMITQYAGAARVAENRVLSTPASVMSISTAANQEDFVSMGSIGAIHLAKVIRNTQIVIAIEMLCALRGLQISYNFLPENIRTLGTGTNRVYEFLKREENLPPVYGDTYLRTELDKIIELVRNGKLIDLVEDLL
ncbi:MAG: aromatic amino acid lyase [Lewinellaceae bacterium]|nr:aromatic amino acid lyase [Lewinellaceae bacterium]